MVKRIAVIGDAMTDIYVHGHTEPCQDDCLKFVAMGTIRVPGGAFNAARSLSHCDCRVRYFGVSLDNSPRKTRFLTDKIIFRFDDDRLIISEEERAIQLQALWDWDPDAILVSDYDKGFLTEEVIQQIVKHPLVVVDVKRPPAFYRGVTVLKGNREYCRKYGKTDVMTDGALAPHVGNAIPFRGKQVSCVNHVGAGDCFAAHLTLALADGLSLIGAATIAHSAGRVYVQHLHNRPPYPSEIASDLESRD